MDSFNSRLSSKQGTFKQRYSNGLTMTNYKIVCISVENIPYILNGTFTCFKIPCVNKN